MLYAKEIYVYVPLKNNTLQALKPCIGGRLSWQASTGTLTWRW